MQTLPQNPPAEPQTFCRALPKGPFRTKNTTTIAKIVNYYAVVFLLGPPDLLRGPFLERENVCNSQENDVRTRCATIVNHRAIVKILRVVNLQRVVFLVRRGPLGGGRGTWTRLLRTRCSSSHTCRVRKACPCYNQSRCAALQWVGSYSEDCSRASTRKICPKRGP